MIFAPINESENAIYYFPVTTYGVRTGEWIAGRDLNVDGEIDQVDYFDPRRRIRCCWWRERVVATVGSPLQSQEPTTVTTGYTYNYLLFPAGEQFQIVPCSDLTIPAIFDAVGTLFQKFVPIFHIIRAAQKAGVKPQYQVPSYLSVSAAIGKIATERRTYIAKGWASSY